MLQLDQVTQQNASAAEELAASSEEMASQASMLQKMMTYFSLPTEERFTQPTATVPKPAQATSTPPKKQAAKPAPTTPPKDKGDTENLDDFTAF